MDPSKAAVERILTVWEAADILRISKSKMYEMIHDNEVPYVRLGGRFIVPEKSLYEWIHKQVTGGYL